MKKQVFKRKNKMIEVKKRISNIWRELAKIKNDFYKDASSLNEGILTDYKGENPATYLAEAILSFRDLSRKLENESI